MSSNGSADTILVRDESRVRIITINRPDRKNALDVPMRAKIAALATEAHTDPEIRAMIITGADGTFCSGADVGAMQQRQDPTAARERVETAQIMTRGIAGGPTPVIAAVEGIALGAGLAVALACDHIIAASNARLSAAFVNVGLAGDAGVLFTLPQRVGPGRARNMLMLGRMVEAAEALRIGLVDELTEPGHALDRALDVATRLAAGPPLALGALKKAFSGLPASLAQALEFETDLQAPLLGSNDFLEAITAFKEKRKPHFTGT